MSPSSPKDKGADGVDEVTAGDAVDDGAEEASELPLLLPEDRAEADGAGKAEIVKVTEDEPDVPQKVKPAKQQKKPGAFRRLYLGQTHFDFIGRKWLWFGMSAIVIVAGMLSLGIRGLNFGIDFKGGSQWEVLAPGVSVNQVQTATTNAGLTNPTIEVLGGKTVDVQADLNNLHGAQQVKISNQVTDALAKLAHKAPEQVSVTHVGPTWGGTVTDDAVKALIIFFILIAIYISIRFEWKMAVAAIVAVIHDILVTVGVYALVGFQVTPDTVVAILTILGYSLYDTIVVFDRVRENSKGLGASGRMTYSDMVNLSMNQTLARSLNTSLVAIIPVFSILVVGAEILGATTLQEFGLALLVGLISGAYSSIFIASPILAMLKEREARYITIRQRLETRGDRYGILTPAAAAALAAAGGSSGRAAKSGSPARGGAIKPGSARPKAPGGAPAAGGGNGASPSGAGRPTGAPTKTPAKKTAKRPPPRPRKSSANNRKKRR